MIWAGTIEFILNYQTTILAALALAAPAVFAIGLWSNEDGDQVWALKGTILIVLWQTALWHPLSMGLFRGSIGGLVPAAAPAIALPVVGVCVGLFVSSAFRARLSGTSLAWLTGVQSLRLFGFVFIALADAGVLPPRFATAAGPGDMTTGALSVLALIALLMRWRPAIALTLVANVLGLLDALSAMRTVFATYQDWPVLTQYPFVAVLVRAVPIFLLAHVMTFWRIGSLWRARERRAPEQTGFALDARNFQKNALQAGQMLPDFSARTVAGETAGPEDWRGRWIHLALHRYAGCPVCSLVVRNAASDYERLRERNIVSVAVFHSPAKQVRKYLGGEPLPLTVLCDPQCSLYRLLGARASMTTILHPGTWLHAARSAFRSGTLNPMAADLRLDIVPADFLIDPSGKIRAVHYGTFVGDSWSPADVLAFQTGLDA